MDVIFSDQQAEFARRHAGPSYSRVVVVRPDDCSNAEIKTGWSCVLGNAIWLMRIQVWVKFRTGTLNDDYWARWRVVTNETSVSTDAEVLACENPLRVYGDAESGDWLAFEKGNHWDFPCRMFWQGSKRRFGLHLYNKCASIAVAFAAFEISEG